MSRVATLSVAYAVSLPFVPRDIKIPEHYWISTYACRILAELATTPPTDPVKLTRVTWLWTELMRCTITLLKYTLIEPLIALAYLIEMTIRWDFQSATQMGEENVQAMKTVIGEYKADLDRLKPVARTVVEIENLARRIIEGFEVEIQQSEATIAALEQQVCDIMEARKLINVEALQEAARKVSVYVQQTLSDPAFLQKLEIDDQRYVNIEIKLEESIERLTKARDKLHQKLQTLEALMVKYERLGYERTTHIEALKRKAESLIRQFTITPERYVTHTTITVR